MFLGHSTGVTDSHVGLAVRKAQDVIATDYLQRYLGLVFPPVRQPGDQPAASEEVRRGHAQRLAYRYARSTCEHRRKGVKAAAQDRKDQFTGFRQVQGTRPSMKQRLAAKLLQKMDLMADCGRRNAEFRRGKSKTQVPGGTLKGSQCVERR